MQDGVGFLIYHCIIPRVSLLLFVYLSFEVGVFKPFRYEVCPTSLSAARLLRKIIATCPFMNLNSLKNIDYQYCVAFIYNIIYIKFSSKEVGTKEMIM